MTTHMSQHFKLSTLLCPTKYKEWAITSHIPHAWVVRCLMYAMVYTRLDIAHAITVVSSNMSNPSKENWNAIKWIM